MNRIISTLCVLFFCVRAVAEPDAAVLAKGKALYNSAGSCVACHMADGKGQPGSIPPLANSDWLGNTDRTIAIVLRGMAGPIKVNGKRFYSAMPPQLLFDDEKLALMITYVNHQWGKGGPEVAAETVAAARASLPADVYNPYSLLKAFPFEKKLQRRNGPFKPDFDDVLTNVTEPVVYRTFMPGASPAAFAVALPGNQFYCWDAGECRLRYVWTKGGFIKGNKVHWSSNGKPVAEFNGIPYYRARSSLLKTDDYKYLAETNRKLPFYDTSEAKDFPFHIEGVEGQPRYKGYRLIKGYPEFRYQYGKHEIREKITGREAGAGIVRNFAVEPPVELSFLSTPCDTCKVTASAGTFAEDGELKLSAQDSASFDITITDLNPTVATTP